MDQNYQNQQSPGGYAPQEPLPNATLILVLGILSILVCQPLGIAALIMGNNSLDAYRRSPERYTENSLGNVKAGRICGIIGICLLALVIILMIAGVSVASWFGMRDRGL
ncbi:MAG: hypothetical protein JWP27_1417 [Flaviaesturariibacter sp.]|nr:hypothetical protein [Flaviaesturariibacter sp.]